MFRLVAMCFARVHTTVTPYDVTREMCAECGCCVSRAVGAQVRPARHAVHVGSLLISGARSVVQWKGEGNVLFNDALGTFNYGYIWE